MLVNSAGTLPIILRSALIGEGLLVVAIMIVVQSVPRLEDMIRVRIFVFRTKIMMANTAGTLPINGDFRTGIGKGLLVRPMIIVVRSVFIKRKRNRRRH